MDYYFHFLAGIPASHAASRLTLLSAHDTSPRALTQKILERPRLVEKIWAAIPDPSRAYMTVFRTGPLERRLATLLDIPLNAADPELEALCTKSSGRRVLREADVDVPFGFEDLRDEDDVVAALQALMAQRPGIRRAVLKLEHSRWEEGHALVDLPSAPTRDGLRQALRGLRGPDGIDGPSYLERFGKVGGVVEEIVDGVEKVVSGQVRINPRGEVILTSTHDELRGGHMGLESVGCLFPADERCRPYVQEAALRVGHVLAGNGLISRLSVEFLVCAGAGGRAPRLVGTEINLGVGGSTHPLLAVRFLTDGQLEPETGLFRSPSGEAKFYRATDNLHSDAYCRLLPEDLIDILTVDELHYSAHGETGALFYMLGAISELGRVGMVAVGNSHDGADAIFRRTQAALDAASCFNPRP
ncbi:MAG: carboxylate-amine ligase [Acidobacteria bacterium]|nr:MAG: carboxylate-amine ligase [Acidobacteriota bacterium]